MEAIKLKPSLEKFLKERGVYEQFLFNVEHDTLEITKIENINGCRGGDCFSIAFIWEDTPEGHSYWEELAEEFEKIDIN